MKKESNSSKKKELINLHSMKSKQAFIMLIVMLVQIFTPIMKVNAAENNYKVLLWNVWKSADNTKTIPPLKYHFNHIDGVTVIEKNSGMLTESEIEDVQLIYIYDTEVGINDDKGKDILASSELINDFINAGGRVVMNGENPLVAVAGDELLSNLATRIGGNFVITTEEGTFNQMTFNTSDKGELVEGLNANNFKPFSFANIVSTNPNAIWVSKNAQDQVFILDQAVGNGFITSISDYNWLYTDISNYTDYSNARNVANRKFLQNLLVSSANHMEYISSLTSYTVNDDLIYNGEEQTGIIYDSDTTNITGTYKATNVGDYTATLTPKDGYVWSDDKTTDARVVNWSISKQSLTIPTLSNTAKSFTDSEQSPTITGYDENTMTQTGTASAKDAGNYTITWNLKDTDNYKWNDNTITEKSANWSIGTVDIPDTMIKFEDNEVTYDGDEHSIKITGNLPGGTIEYSTDGVNYSETLPTFTDVGEYTIYYRASKSNYNDKVGSNTLKINQKALTEYTIIIENQVYTGEEIKPTIIVKDGDRIVPSTEYELEFEDNIGPGTGKVVVKNKDGGNYIISTKNATFMIIDPGKVEFIDPTTPNSNNAKVIESADEVIAKIDFTDEDLDKINQGKNIDVYLEVKDINNSISSSDKSKIEEKLGNDKLGLYLDVSLFKKVEGEEATKITETKTPITISFEIPEELINKDSNVERTFKVLRLHDGNVEEIEVKVNGNIATFETDKFSTYALTYNDVITTSNPHTGDNIGTSFVMLIISSLGLISALGYIVISNKRKLVKTNN